MAWKIYWEHRKCLSMKSKACGTWSVTLDNPERQLAELLQFVKRNLNIWGLNIETEQLMPQMFLTVYSQRDFPLMEL